MQNSTLSAVHPQQKELKHFLKQSQKEPNIFSKKNQKEQKTKHNKQNEPKTKQNKHIFATHALLNHYSNTDFEYPRPVC